MIVAYKLLLKCHFGCEILRGGEGGRISQVFFPSPLYEPLHKDNRTKLVIFCQCNDTISIVDEGGLTGQSYL